MHLVISVKIPTLRQELLFYLMLYKCSHQFQEEISRLMLKLIAIKAQVHSEQSLKMVSGQILNLPKEHEQE